MCAWWLQARCFWGVYKGLGLSHRKTAMLLRVMLERAPRKKYYLKVDADTIFRPRNALAFLRYLHRHVDPAAPICACDAPHAHGTTRHTAASTYTQYSTRVLRVVCVCAVGTFA